LPIRAQQEENVGSCWTRGERKVLHVFTLGGNMKKVGLLNPTSDTG